MLDEKACLGEGLHIRLVNDAASHCRKTGLCGRFFVVDRCRYTRATAGFLIL